MNDISKARIVAGIGIVLCIILFVKASIIGWYPSEQIGLFVFAAIAIGTMWIGSRMYVAAKKSAVAQSHQDMEGNK